MRGDYFLSDLSPIERIGFKTRSLLIYEAAKPCRVIPQKITRPFCISHGYFFLVALQVAHQQPRCLKCLGLRGAVFFLRSAYPYSIRSVRADLVHRAAKLPCPDTKEVSLLLRMARGLLNFPKSEMQIPIELC